MLINHAGFVTRNCPVCGAGDASVEVASSRRAENLEFEELRPLWFTFAQEKIFFSYSRCNDCRVLFAPAFFTGKQLSDLYAQMPPNMEVVPTDAIEATQRSYFDAAAAAAPLEGHYLELGPDVGYIAGHAAREGRFEHFWLYEPNRGVHETLAEAVEGRPHDISVEMTDLSIVPDGSVGLAVMVHVLDHLLDPAALLEQIHLKLRPGGTLMLVTHNEGSLLRRLMGRRWPPFCLQHPELYNPRSIAELLTRTGYSSVRVKRAKNYFPVAFMARQAAHAAGLKLERMPLPQTVVGLRLGNMLTLARR